jgi:putative transposase
MLQLHRLRKPKSTEALKHTQGKLRRLNKELSRRKKDQETGRRPNANWPRLTPRGDVGRMHYKMTSEIVRAKRTIARCHRDVERKGMTRNHRLAGAVSDASFHEARRQFQYKSRGTAVVCCLPISGSRHQSCV